MPRIMAFVAMTGWTPLRIAGRGLKWLWGKSKPLTVAAVVVIGTVHVTSYIKKQKRRKKWNNAGKDVVVLHMFPRGYFCPNLSPFVVKLETYLRMAKIPYQVDYEEPIGPKGKCPWITLNGEEIGDSQLIIEKLGSKYGKDYSSDLTPEQYAIAHAMRVMVDEHLLWCLVVWRYIVDGGASISICMKFPVFFRILIPVFRRKVKKAVWMQGIGRHSFSEVEEIGRKDLSALSAFLGENTYLMGDKATEVDCAAFGMLSQIIWNSPNSPYLKMLDTEFTNLHAYCQRVKEEFWPDWNDCLVQPFPKCQ